MKVCNLWLISLLYLSAIYVNISYGAYSLVEDIESGTEFSDGENTLELEGLDFLYEFDSENLFEDFTVATQEVFTPYFQVVDENFKCPICKIKCGTYDIAQQEKQEYNLDSSPFPVYAPCGHSFCDKCFNDIYKPKSIISCPYCRSSFCTEQFVINDFCIYMIFGFAKSNNLEYFKNSLRAYFESNMLASTLYEARSKMDLVTFINKYCIDKDSFIKELQKYDNPSPLVRKMRHKINNYAPGLLNYLNKVITDIRRQPIASSMLFIMWLYIIKTFIHMKE